MSCARHVFGPVPSRRLGASLGIDLVPFKTCTYDCVYCQLGRTTCLTVERQEYVPVDEILREFEERMSLGCDASYVTLSGSGEPTLHSRIGDVIAGIKRRTRLPVAVLTNGSLLSDPSVCEALHQADLVIPSLDAGDEETFRRVNRPHPLITFQRMVDGLWQFASRFSGAIWLEVFLLAGVTDTVEDTSKIAKLISGLPLDRVQLNTVERPPAEATARPVPVAELRRFADCFPVATDILVADPRQEMPGRNHHEGAEGEMIELLARRPCTIEDIILGLGIHRQEAIKFIEALVERGAVKAQRREKAIYYMFERKGSI